MDANRFATVFNKIVDNINTVIHGKDDVVRLSMTAICAGGHILFEDVPGVGKSMLARAISQSIKADTSRVQCTPDMLPGDITGSSIIDTKTMKFVFREGPVFANVLLVDEINRATPKTQSALLEAMAEKNVTVDGVTHALPKPFMVLATQNPVELAGTFPLPEAQLDRFLFKLSIGYATREAEKQVLQANRLEEAIVQLSPVASQADVLEMQAWAKEVDLADEVMDFIIDLCQATREDASLLIGASTRASLALMRASRVLAAADGREDAYPEDVRAVLLPVWAHRLVLTPDAQLRDDTVEKVIERVSGRVKPPMGVGARK